MRRSFITWALASLAVFLPMGIFGAVQLEIDGLGWRTDKRNERMLEDVLDIESNPDVVLEAAIVEDALFILRGELIRDGYLSPDIQYSLFSGEELILNGSWNNTTDVYNLPWQKGNRLLIEVDKGIRSYLSEVEFEGLSKIPIKEALSYFIPKGGLMGSRAASAYSPMKLESQMRALQNRLGQLGHLEADVSVGKSPETGSKGEVVVQVIVVEGPQFIWGSGSCDVNPAEGIKTHAQSPPAGEVFNAESLQDWMAEVRSQYLEAGYPDVSVSVNQERILQRDNRQVIVNVSMGIDTGERVRLGKVAIDGIEHSKEAFLVKQTRLTPGSWLNRPEVQAAQFRLGQLGIFRRVAAEFEESPTGGDESVRDVRFIVNERERQTLSVLFGYGSYEQLRIGLQARALNILGRAHSGHIRLRQTMKSSSGDFYYTIPRPLPWLSSGQVRLQGLLREEVSFDREEALAAVGVERNFLGGSLRTTAEYRYELLQSKGFEPLVSIGDTNSAAGSLNIGISWDTRDQVVFPHNGVSLQGILELASTAIGSESNYQRMIVRSSYHHTFDNGWLRYHLGFEGGILSRLGSSPFEFPTNKRFFPGGENSIRGYKEGEASPVNPEGIQIGAEAYTLAHVELELGLSNSLSLVLFTDGLWSTPYLDGGANGEFLYSTGLGFRYSTPIGPLRLEYAHNINPRQGDPDGTLHLSVGFPF